MHISSSVRGAATLHLNAAACIGRQYGQGFEPSLDEQTDLVLAMQTHAPKFLL